MGELKAAIKSIAFMFTSDLNKAEKWTAAHPALTVEEKVYREYMIKDMNGKLNETIAQRVRVTNDFVKMCKLKNEQHPHSSEDDLKAYKLRYYMMNKDDPLTGYGMIPYDDILKIIDDTRPSRMKAEEKEREENHYTKEKAWEYYKTYFEEEEKKDKKKKKK